MDPRQIDKAVGKYIPTARLIAIGFAASVLLYAAVAYLLIGVLGHQQVLEVPLYLAAAIAVSQFLTILAGWLISLSIRRPHRARGVTIPSGTAGSTDAAAAAESADAKSTTPEVVADEAMQRYIKSVVVAAGLRELASIVGLVLTVLTANMTWVLLLGGAALISMLVHWPRRGAIEDFLQQQGLAR